MNNIQKTVIFSIMLSPFIVCASSDDRRTARFNKLQKQLAERNAVKAAAGDEAAKKALRRTNELSEEISEQSRAVVEINSRRLDTCGKARVSLDAVDVAMVRSRRQQGATLPSKVTGKDNQR